MCGKENNEVEKTACMNTQLQNKSVYKKKKDLLWEEGRNPQ